ncbi:MAG: hypothetical protein ACUVQ5_04200 [Candidatus Methanomethylicaceae archaeon]
MRSHEHVLNTVSTALIIGASANILYTLFTIYSETEGFCGPEGVTFIQLPLLAVMPLNYIMLLMGTGGLASPYVRTLIKKGFSIMDLKRLLFGMVVSGGSLFSNGNKYCIRFYGKDLVLHQIFADMTYVIYDARPGTLCVRNSYVTQLYSKEAVKELKEYSPEFGVRKGEIPSISFLLEGGAHVKTEAARVLMSTSGWIACSFVNTTSGVRAYPKMGMGSMIPYSLISNYLVLMSDVNLKFKVYSDSRYKGRGYLVTSEMKTLERFTRLGGFLEGTSVKKGAFEGIEKNELLTSLMATYNLKFASKEEAIRMIKTQSLNDELGIYLNRLMLG